MLTQRDKEILRDLDRFGLMSREQIEKIHFPNVARPHVNANRVLKRLTLSGHVIQLPQPRDCCYVYKSVNLKHKVKDRTSKFHHYLEVVDTYIDLQPEEFYTEWQLDWKNYNPDAYAKVNGKWVCIEVQRSKITNKKMNKKIREFVRSWQKQEHDAMTLWIKSDLQWEKLQAPKEFGIKISPSWN